jgi:hypothetical protein
MAKTRPTLFHATALHSWESIAASGLLPAAHIAASGGHAPLTAVRAESLRVSMPSGEAVIRDQAPLLGGRIMTSLDGVSLLEWMEILNQRVFLFAKRDDLDGLLAVYKAVGQDVLIFDTAKTLKALAGSVEVCKINSGALGRSAASTRGPNTFIPLAGWTGTPSQIREVTIVGGIMDVTGLVRRVERHFPDGTMELIT